MNEIGHSVIHDLISEIIYGYSNIDFASSYKQLQTIDKEYFHEIILENKIAPSFIKYINNKNLSNLICKSFYNKCKIQAKRYQIHSLQVINEIRELNRLFTKEGLTFIYLKGIAIQKEYEDISLRPMVDIDILFKKEDLLRAYEILHRNNFLSPNQQQYLDKNNIDDFCSCNHNIHIITKNNISVELHHRVTKPQDFINCPISRDFFDDFTLIDHFHEKIIIPSIENIIIHSLCHFSINSSFNRLLRTLIDIECISLNHEIQWEDIILKYDNVKIRKGISLSLELISLNKGNIQNLDRIRTLLNEYFPEEDLVQTAQQKLLDITNPSFKENFLNRFKSLKYLKTIPRVLLPSINMLKFKYEISNPSLRTYLKYYNEQFQKASFFSIIKKDGDHYSYINKINRWLNKDK